jgi:hypothetical protein
MELKLKKKYEGLKMSNGKVQPFFTSDITTDQIAFYCKAGFDFIFEIVKEKKVKK